MRSRLAKQASWREYKSRGVSTKDLARVISRDVLQEDNIDDNSREHDQRSGPGHQPVFIYAQTRGRRNALSTNGR
jgi:hypothetical protein